MAGHHTPRRAAGRSRHGHHGCGFVCTMTGPALFHKYVLDELTGWLFRSPWKMFRSAINFSRYSFWIGRSPFAQLKELHSWAARLLVAVALPLGFAMSFRDKRPAT